MIDANYIAHLKRLAAMGSKDAASKLAVLQPVPPAKGADGKAGAAGGEGPRGATGPDGAEGPMGPVGPRGPDGYPGLDGEQGAVGPDGAEGPTGPEGPRGPDGKPGPDGKAGPDGKQGPPGLSGLDGAHGPPGFRGDRGPAGDAGPAGPMLELLTGGDKGQVLAKASDDDGDFQWVTAPKGGSAEPSMFWAQQPPGSSGITQVYADAHYDALGAADSAVAAHVAAPDPHPQYLTPAEGNGLYDALGAAALRVLANGAIVAGTNTKITYDAKGLVVSAAAATTADIPASANKNYVTDAQAVVIGNTSGVNTGDQSLAAYLLKNGPITGATKTKITYDANGLVTAGADATTADIAASANKNYVTDAQAVVIGNTSGANSGDVTLAGENYITRVNQVLTLAKITEAQQNLTDVTTGDASTAAHGYMKKLPGGTANFYRADGTFAAPVAALPDLIQTRLSNVADATIAAGYGSYVPEEFEVGNTFFFEIGAGSVLEIG